MRKLFTVALSENEDQVLLLTAEKDRVFHAREVLPDADGHEAAIKTAAIEALREVL